MSRSEFQIIRDFFVRQKTDREDVTLGIGDDCAVVTVPAGQQLCLTIDTLIAGVHFPQGTNAEDIGHKSLAVSLSDLAAMGAEPAWATLALALPDANEEWLRGFCHGLFSLAAEYDVQLIGGDTTHSNVLTITTQLHGFVPTGRYLKRNGAQIGDYIYVSGTIGDAGLGLRRVQGAGVRAESNADPCVRRLNRPLPRVAEGLALRDLAHACIDVSDGLAADLGHILQASAVGAELELARLPLSDALRAGLGAEAPLFALSSGDDYELCFTSAPSREPDLLARFAALGASCTRIGTVTAQAGLRVHDAAGLPVALAQTGYDHFVRSGDAGPD